MICRNHYENLLAIFPDAPLKKERLDWLGESRKKWLKKKKNLHRNKIARLSRRTNRKAA